MKNFLLVVFLVASLCSFSQSYVPIPDTLAVWRQTYAGWSVINQYQIFTAEKVTIDSFKYTVLRKTGNGNIYDSTFGYTNALFGLFRNDSAARKVYFRKSFADTADKLLYDFNLDVGDTIGNWYGNNWLNVIDSVDIVWMFGQPRRRLSFIDYSFAPGAEGAIIEGIGSIHGFAEQLTVPLEPQWYLLECFSYKDTAYSFSYHSLPPLLAPPTSLGSSCWLYSEIKDIENNLSIQTFPNPFTSQLTFTVANSEPGTIILYDIFSRQILQQAFTNSTTLNTEPLAAGIYFYELRNDKGAVKKGKVVKE